MRIELLVLDICNHLKMILNSLAVDKQMINIKLSWEY